MGQRVLGKRREVSEEFQHRSAVGGRCIDDES
jgi:hypothetical protein